MSDSNPDPSRLNPGRDDGVLPRRSFLKAGLLGSAGLGLADLLRFEARADAGAVAARRSSVIIL
ncbi:MAG: hypothetical protein JWN86_20 [Planctomycetota bacterium]|nr:hypothetical protein [Planctomycetota bacterium]